MKNFTSTSYPSNPTLPSQLPAGYTTPLVPKRENKPPMSDQELTARRDQFYEMFLRQVVTAIAGVFTGESDSFTQLSDWSIELATDIGGLLDSVIAGLQSVFLVGDIIEVLTGKEDGNTSDLGTIWNGQVTNIRQTVDNIVSALFGWVGSNFNHDDALQALEDTAAAVASLSAAVQALQNNRNNEAVNGASAIVDFSTMPDSGSLPSSFSVTYSGTGTSSWTVSEGRTNIAVVYDDDRNALARFLDLQSTTDYQIIGAAFASAPEWGNQNIAAYNEIYGRMNSTGTDYVYARLSKYRVQLGCVVSGTPTVFDEVTSGFSFKSNTLYWLACGTVGGLRIFQVLEGTIPILAHTEVGTTSQVDSSHRFMGMGMHVDATPWNVRRPARVAAWAFADNQPPTVVGSGSIMTRTSTGTVTLAVGLNHLATNFFDTPTETTPDITQDRSQAKFTVSIPGWYNIDANIKLTTNVPPNGIGLVLYRNTSVYKYIGVAMLGDGGSDPPSMNGGCMVYLDAGDYVRLAIHGYNAGSLSGVLTGEAGGVETYFSIALANRSLA